tara:strand:+ start:533 stop:1723 length:1191 start_codon:yes stop_codon:yes gene_type:complete
MTIVDKVLHFFRLRQRGINIKRVACVICKSQKLTQLKEIKDFPAYMGVYDGKASFNLGNLRYMRCDNCSSLQLGELIPLEILYQSNHNVGIIGETWTQHFEQLGSFIIKNSNCDKILEIGDPSAKTALVCAQKSSYYEWVIIEPNPDTTVPPPPQVRYEKMWFDNYQPNNKLYDTVVLSHVFEHLYNPVDTLAQIKNILTPDGRLIISIPDMKYLLDQGSLPPAGLHFEHTYYLDIEVLTSILYKAGFIIEECKNYKNHSLFLSCSKSKITGITKRNDKHGLEICDRVIEVLDKLSFIAKDLNQKITNVKKPVYLYGAHFPAQLLLSMGVEESNITGILDNAEEKIGKKLYGTNLNVHSPKILSDHQAYVICHMGAYTDEIKKDILENINGEIIFL